MHTLRAGDIVRHEQFGLGVVMEDQHAGEVPIDFDGEVQVFAAAAPFVRVSEQEEQARRRDTFHQEKEGECEHFPGSHLEPFYRTFDRAAAKIQAVVDAEMTGRFSPDCLPPRASMAASIEWPADPVYFTGPEPQLSMRAIVQVNASGEPELVAFFPYVGGGQQCAITIERVTVWPGGLEAQIDGAVGAAAVSFFDCRYGENRNRYEKDARLEFLLSAIAYECSPAEQEAIDVAFDDETRNVIFGASDESPARVSLEGSSMLCPIDEWDCDDYWFRGPVRRVEAVRMLGRKAWIVTARVCQGIAEETGDPDDLDLPIVITDRSVATRLPASGRAGHRRQSVAAGRPVALKPFDAPFHRTPARNRRLRRSDVGCRILRATSVRNRETRERLKQEDMPSSGIAESTAEPVALDWLNEELEFYTAWNQEPAEFHGGGLLSMDKLRLGGGRSDIKRARPEAPEEAG